MLMKPTDFAKYLTEFLSVYLPSQKNVSKNTVYSYRDTFKLLIKYCQETQNIPAERITVNLLSNELIVGFLQWLETERGCSISTRNQRLAAIHSFFRFGTLKRSYSTFSCSPMIPPSTSGRRIWSKVEKLVNVK